MRNFTMTKLITILLTISLVCSAEAVRARSYVFGVTGGGPTISPNSTQPALIAGDTLLVGGQYYSLSFQGLQGAAGKPICVIMLPSSIITSSASYNSGAWSDCAFVRVIGMNSRNNAAPVVWLRARCHDLSFEGCSFTNDRGRYSTQQAFLLDDKNSTAMNFDGSKASTFYNISVLNCAFDGFQGVNAIECGSEGRRSVVTDLTVEGCTFKRITTYGAVVPGAVGGTIFNFQCHHNRFDSILVDVGAYQRVHASILTGYGNGDVAYNFFTTTYAAPIRWNPLAWKGLPGYAGALTIHDNVFYDLKSYDAVEVSNNNSGPRLSALACDTAASDVYQNTVLRTTRMSYNGDYHGFIVGVLSHKVRVRDNVIVDPEHGTPYNPAGRGGYIVAFISGPQPGFDSAGNRCYPTAAAAGIDTVAWQLAANSPLVDQIPASPSTVDVWGTARPQGKAVDLGGIERVVAGPPTPVPRRLVGEFATVINGQLVVTLSWSDGTSTTYQ